MQTEIARNKTILHQNAIRSTSVGQACSEMALFVETLKRVLEDDHGVAVNDSETVQRLLKRYRVHCDCERNGIHDNTYV